MQFDDFSGWKDALLLTPGPLTTSKSVKARLLTDYGSWDQAFIDITAEVRSRLLDLAKTDSDRYTVIPLQGCGTGGLEGTFLTCVGEKGKVLVAVNGAYGERHVTILERAGIAHDVIRFGEDIPVSSDDVAEKLSDDPSISHVCVTHCETTTGIMNPVEDIGSVCREKNVELIVDAMSTFGAVELDIEEAGIDYLVSSSNKCIEGVPGFCYVIARKEPFLKTEGQSRSLTLDLYDQWQYMEKCGRFRYTPPTGVVAAFLQALRELEEEGGVSARERRYRENHRILVDGMRSIGFRTFLPDELQSHIITTFLYPADKTFTFEEFYDRLYVEKYVIYPGKLTETDCFRIGSIGRIFPRDMRDVTGAVGRVVRDMDITF